MTNPTDPDPASVVSRNAVDQRTEGNDADLPPTPSPNKARLQLAVRVIRWCLWTGIFYGAFSVIAGLIHLLSPGTQTPTSATGSPVEVPETTDSFEASLLTGYWAAIDSPFGITVSHVSAEELQKRLLSVPSRPAEPSDPGISEEPPHKTDEPQSAEFETALMTLAVHLKGASEKVGSTTVYSGQHSGVHYRLIMDEATASSAATLRLGQVYWAAEPEGWTLAQVVRRSNDASEYSNTLLPWLSDQSKPLAFRLSEQGQVTGAVYSCSLSFSQLKAKCEAVGRSLTVDNEDEQFLSGRVASSEDGPGSTVLCAKIADSGYLFVLDPQAGPESEM